MPNNQTDIGEGEDQKKEVYFSVAILPENMSHKVANILMDSLFWNSEQVADKHGVGGSYVRNLICKHRSEFDQLKAHKNLVIQSRLESAQMRAVELVTEGLTKMDAPTTPSQAMALTQCASQLSAMKDKLTDETDQRDTKKIIENGTKAALKLRNKANGK